MTGHQAPNCIPFAKYLLFHAAEKNLDSATQTKLIENYKTEIRRKKDLRLKRQQLGTIRQMWHKGTSYEEFESSLLDTLPDMKEAIEYSSEALEDEE
jgi:hypothetical protein